MGKIRTAPICPMCYFEYVPDCKTLVNNSWNSRYLWYANHFLQQSYFCDNVEDYAGYEYYAQKYDRVMRWFSGYTRWKQDRGISPIYEYRRVSSRLLLPPGQANNDDEPEFKSLDEYFTHDCKDTLSHALIIETKLREERKQKQQESTIIQNQATATENIRVAEQKLDTLSTSREQLEVEERNKQPVPVVKEPNPGSQDVADYTCDDIYTTYEKTKTISSEKCQQYNENGCGSDGHGELFNLKQTCENILEGVHNPSEKLQEKRQQEQLAIQQLEQNKLILKQQLSDQIDKNQCGTSDKLPPEGTPILFYSGTESDNHELNKLRVGTVSKDSTIKTQKTNNRGNKTKPIVDGSEYFTFQDQPRSVYYPITGDELIQVAKNSQTSFHKFFYLPEGATGTKPGILITHVSGIVPSAQKEVDMQPLLKLKSDATNLFTILKNKTEVYRQNKTPRTHPTNEVLFRDKTIYLGSYMPGEPNPNQAITLKIV